MVAPIVAAGARAALGKNVRGRAVRAAAGAAQGRGGGGGGTKHRVSTITAVFMIVLALLFDLVQFFLTLSVVLAIMSVYITFLAACSFAIWFALLGVNYFSGRKAGMKMLAALGGLIAELVPIINALPATTVSVLVVILLSRVEDKDSKSPNVAANDNGLSEGRAAA